MSGRTDATAPAMRSVGGTGPLGAEAGHLARLLENFGVLAEAPGGVNALRKLVLSAAFEGSLDAPTGSRTGWRRCALGDVAAMITKGTTPTSLGFPFQVEGIRFVKVENVKRGEVRPETITDFISEDAHQALSRSRLEAGDVLFSIAGTIGETCVVRRGDLPANTNQALAIIRGTAEVFHPDFLRRQLDSFVSESLRARARGGAMMNVSLGDLRALPVVVPPLAEQKRIVAKVDQLMALCDDLEARQAKKREIGTRLTKAALDALTTAEGPEEFEAAWGRVVENFGVVVDRAEVVTQLRRAALELAVRGRLTRPSASSRDVEALESQIASEKASAMEGRRSGRGRGDRAESTREAPPYPLPLSWRWRSLDDVAGHIVDGTHHTPTYVERGVDFISAKDIRHGLVRFEGCRQISEQEFDELARRCRPQRGDVLVTKSGSIGEVAVVDTDRSFTLFESVALVPVVKAVNPRYAAYVIFLGASGAFGAANQRGVGVRHLHLVDLRRLPFPLPPRIDQDAIVAKVEQLMTLCDTLEAHLRRSEALAAKLAQAAVQQLLAPAPEA